MLKNLLTDRWAIHIDAYTMNRYRLIKPYLKKGHFNALNIGTGGGVETLRLLRRGNTVTILEIDSNTAEKTMARIRRNGFAEKVDCICGHFLKVPVNRQFDEIMMCEVLEHIKDDQGSLKKLSSLSNQGARLILSTPTASCGQLMGDEVVEEEDPVHPEYHVRPGYDGPELDTLMQEAGFAVEKRIFNGYLLTQQYHLIERFLRRYKPLMPLAIFAGLAGRIFVPLLELIRIRPSNQITIAHKI